MFKRETLTEMAMAAVIILSMVSYLMDWELLTAIFSLYGGLYIAGVYAPAFMDHLYKLHDSLRKGKD